MSDADFYDGCRRRQRAYARLACAADDKRHAWVDQSGTTPDANKLHEAQ